MKILATLLMAFVLTGIVKAQEIFPTISGEGIFADDSLYCTYIDTSATPDDTLTAVTYKVFFNDYRYDFATISIRDTGASIDDTVTVEYSNAHNLGEWYPVEFMRDSTWTNVTLPLTDDNSQHSYVLYIAPYYAVRVRRTNTVNDTANVTYFNFQAQKK